MAIMVLERNGKIHEVLISGLTQAEEKRVREAYESKGWTFVRVRYGTW